MTMLQAGPVEGEQSPGQPGAFSCNALPLPRISLAFDKKGFFLSTIPQSRILLCAWGPLAPKGAWRDSDRTAVNTTLDGVLELGGTQLSANVKLQLGPTCH